MVFTSYRPRCPGRGDAVPSTPLWGNFADAEQAKVAPAGLHDKDTILQVTKD